MSRSVSTHAEGGLEALETVALCTLRKVLLCHDDRCLVLRRQVDNDGLRAQGPKVS